jgi:hypothetical protein
MRTTALLLGVSLLGCRGEARAPLAQIRVGSPAGPVTLVREATSSEQGGYDLFAPMRPTPSNGSVWVLEAGNDQLVRFDSALATAASFSREGEGPGEIQFAQDLIIRGDRIIVAETGNGRISTFDTAGTFRSTTPTNESPRFVAELAGTFVATLQSSPHYTYSIDGRGRVAPHAGIPSVIRHMAESDPARYPGAGPYIAASPRGTVFVLDQSVLALSEFAADGTLMSLRLLPEPFRSRLLDERIRTRKAFGALGTSFIDYPAAKRISVDPDGLLLVLFHLPDSWGLVIDTKSWTARPLLLPEDKRLHDILWAASDATLDGDRLYLISGSQLYELALEDWR